MIRRIIGSMLGIALLAVLGVGMAWSGATAPGIGEPVSDSVAADLRGGACFQSTIKMCNDATAVDPKCKAQNTEWFSCVGVWDPTTTDWCGIIENDIQKCVQMHIDSKSTCVITGNTEDTSVP